MDICEDELVTDELQFGFKKGVGCNDVKTVINHFTSSRSSICSAVLDIRKVFDRVPHGKLWNTYVKCGYPVKVSMFCLIDMVNCKQLYIGMGLCRAHC
jgi:Reverse transcriptase (RNA-dependent DNA polymerase)